MLRTLAQKKWGDEITIASQLIDTEYHPLEDEEDGTQGQGVEIVIIGNIFKELKLRPSVSLCYLLRHLHISAS
jgi:hypothetical protein